MPDTILGECMERNPSQFMWWKIGLCPKWGLAFASAPGKWFMSYLIVGYIFGVGLATYCSRVGDTNHVITGEGFVTLPVSLAHGWSIAYDNEAPNKNSGHGSLGEVPELTIPCIVIHRCQEGSLTRGQQRFHFESALCVFSFGWFKSVSFPCSKLYPVSRIALMSSVTTSSKLSNPKAFWGILKTCK